MKKHQFENQVVMDWLKLPSEIWRLIAARLYFLEDYVRFGAVCSLWHMITLEKECYSHREIPWLMLTEDEKSNSRKFHNIFSNKVYKFDLPEICGRRCWGSSRGWLVTVGIDREMHMLNPLSRVQISLPPLYRCSNLKKLVCNPKEFRDSFVCKAVVSSCPSDSNCLVMAIYSDHGKLAFTRPGDDAWTPIECSPSWFVDIVYVNGKLYVVDCNRDVLVFNLAGCHLKTISNPLQEDFDVDYEAQYLVELGGEIYMVLRGQYITIIVDAPYPRTWSFLVYKFDQCSGQWKKVDCLGNYSIFLGSNCSFSLLALDDSQWRRNCIYFTSDYNGFYDTSRSYDMGMYNLDNCKVDHYLAEHVSSLLCSAPIWITPSLW